jgi:hypothetical protein
LVKDGEGGIHIIVDYVMMDYELPVVPHKAVAEVSKIGTYRKGWLL